MSDFYTMINELFLYHLCEKRGMRPHSKWEKGLSMEFPIQFDSYILEISIVIIGNPPGARA